MRGVNKVIIVGNLGNDPEHKTFPNGGSVTNISVATSEQWTDKQTGEKKEATEWHRIVLFNRLGEIAAQYLRKGSKVYIEGSLRTRKWQDQSGQDRYITEIRADQMQMLDSAGASNAGGYQAPAQNAGNNFQGNNPSNNQVGFAGNQGPQTYQNQGGGQNSFANNAPSNNTSAQSAPHPQASPANTGNAMPMSDAPVDDDIPF